MGHQAAMADSLTTIPEEHIQALSHKSLQTF